MESRAIGLVIWNPFTESESYLKARKCTGTGIGGVNVNFRAAILYCQVTPGATKERDVTRILVADDNAPFRAAVRMVLEAEGFEVVEAKDGAEAMRLFREVPVAVVLCDVFMPDKDGLETIQELRRESPGVKIIAISGGAFEGNLDLLGVARQLGAAEILYKPFNSTKLLEAVRRQLESISGAP